MAGMHWQSYTRRPRRPQPPSARMAASSCFSRRIGPIRLMSGFDGPALQVYDSLRPLAGSPKVLRDYRRLRRQKSCFQVLLIGAGIEADDAGARLAMR